MAINPPPAFPPEPLALAEVRLNLRIDYGKSSEDWLLAGLIVAARQHVEDYTGLVLTPRIITETAPLPGMHVELASWPVTSVLAVRYPLAGVMTPLTEGSWVCSVNRRPVRLLPASRGWGFGVATHRLSNLPIEIDVLAGFADPAAVPQTIKQAMHLLIAHFYSNRAAAEVGARAAAVQIPFGVAELLRRWRRKVV